MAEREDYAPMADVDHGDEYYEDEDEDEGMGDPGHESFGQDGEGQEDDQDDSGIQIGDEIELTHSEVWDDTELIEAWDAAVKQYEVYHSKTKVQDNASISSNKHLAESSAASSSPSKRSRPNSTHNNGSSKGESDVSGSGAALTGSGSMATLQTLEQGASATRHVRIAPPSLASPPAAAASLLTPQQSPDNWVASDRKPSFKKADKPSFPHHHQNRATESHVANTKSSNSKAKKKPTTRAATMPSSSLSAAAPASTQRPPVDAATSAYYQQLGYYYDPSYDASFQTAETQGEEGEREGEEEEQQEQVNYRAAGINSAHGTRGVGDRAPAPTRVRNTTFPPNPSASTQNSARIASAGWGPVPVYPPHAYTPQTVYPGYGQPLPAGPSGAHGMLPMPFMPPMPPMPPGTHPAAWQGHGVTAAAAGGGGMDDEALSHLIMAWYYSGYYTGLYQAQRR
ncbi:hypothetical protein BGZ99_000046 [Dissophora globulifera]|uniref:Survival Motor Neuron Gemin2-binding domain-containing protein n=1 Tax=Dissophora globulifera TaxID=979702 RepID=A0A9P6RYX8_9FUNG|nr:hypothetical protein BGZ99_000046 [Dissophora globulifera]